MMGFLRLFLVSIVVGTQSAPRDGGTVGMTGTGAIAGVVVTADSSSRPVRRGVVTLGGGDLPGLQAITDDNGRFAFRGLPAGRYTLNASRPGFVPSTYGATRPGRPGATIVLAQGHQVTNISIKLLGGAVISGVISTERGEPAQGARVSVLTYGTSYLTGERTLVPVGRAGGSFVVTNDRGEYRIFGLAPGDYLVVATPVGAGVGARETTPADYQRALQQVRARAGASPAQTAPAAAAQQTMGNAAILFPGTTLASEAQAIALRPGEERSGVNFGVRPVPTSRITGTIAGPDGQPGANIGVQMIEAAPLPGFQVISLNLRATSDKDGRFTLTGVTPGWYALVARSAAPAGGRGGSAAGLWALTDVRAEGRDLTVPLTLRPGATVSGTVAYLSGGVLPAPADRSRVRVNLQAIVSATGVALSVPPVTTDDAGAFAFAGVTPGRYRLTVTVPAANASTPGWFVKSATLNGRDVMSTPIEISEADAPGVEIVLTDRPTELSGVMQDAAGQPAPEYFLIAFPKDASLWTPQSPRIQQTRPGSDGKFLFRGLPAGDYLLGAVTDVQTNEWYDRAFLQQLVGSAVAIALADGEKKVHDLRVR